MNQPTILLVGDAMLDNYYIGETTRISPEAPIPVVQIKEILTFEGGVGNVLQNLLALGAKVRGLYWSVDKSPTTCPVKNRLICGGQQIARWDQNDHCDPIEFVREWPGTKEKYDAIIVSDYGKGSISNITISQVAELNLPTFIDTKRSPREFEEISNTTFFPNQKEYEQYLQDYALQSKVVVKRGANGIQYQSMGRVIEDRPALAEKVVSVTGAGDTVIAAYVYAACMELTTNWLDFANAAASVVVQKPYTATATLREVVAVLERQEAWQEAGYWAV